jgi:hypothetical protein
VLLTCLLNHCFRLGHFPAPWKKQKSKLGWNPANNQNFPKIYIQLASCPLWQTIWEAAFKNNKKTHWEKKLTNASQFGFQADHTVQYCSM